MTIQEIHDDSIDQQCEFCKTFRQLNFTQMTVGEGCADRLNSRIICLPLCENCQTVEYLVCSSEDEPEHPSPGSFGHRHRLLVDVLRDRLIQSGQVVEGLELDEDKVQEPTQQEIDRWFEDGLRLERRGERKKNGKQD